MTNDPRIDFIIGEIKAAAKEANPDPDVELISEEDEQEARAAIALGLKVFDRLLPMIVNHVIEARKQIEAAK